MTECQFEPMNDPCWPHRIAGFIAATRWPATPTEAIQAGHRLGHRSTMVRMILAAAEELRSLWFGNGQWRPRYASDFVWRLECTMRAHHPPAAHGQGRLLFGSAQPRFR
ncbi:MAG: hypothetical protein JW940_00160 [Polyangiaceae bacterium]|nr:hypothetical protein [Polyangiaceae bacterium]